MNTYVLNFVPFSVFDFTCYKAIPSGLPFSVRWFSFMDKCEVKKYILHYHSAKSVVVNNMRTRKTEN